VELHSGGCSTHLAAGSRRAWGGQSRPLAWLGRGAPIGAGLVAAAINVQNFADFSADNDPYGEHDFGSFEVAGETFFWKIDLYEEPDVKGANGEPVVTPRADDYVG
jgi:hypothetical protein